MRNMGFFRPKPFSPFKKSNFIDHCKSNNTTVTKRVLSNVEQQESKPVPSLFCEQQETKPLIEKKNRQFELTLSLMNSYDDKGNLLLKNEAHKEWERDFESLWNQMIGPPGQIFTNPFPCLEYAFRNMETGIINERQLELIPLITEAFELLTRVLLEWFCKVELDQIRSYEEQEEVHRDLLVQLYREQLKYFPVKISDGHECNKRLCDYCKQFYYKEHQASHSPPNGKKCTPDHCTTCKKGHSLTSCDSCGCDPRSFETDQMYFSCLMGLWFQASGTVFVCRKTGSIHVCGKYCRGVINDPTSYESICTFTDIVKEQLISSISQTAPNESIFKIYQREVGGDFGVELKGGSGKDNRHDYGLVLGAQKDEIGILDTIVSDIFSVTTTTTRKKTVTEEQIKRITHATSKFLGKSRNKTINRTPITQKNSKLETKDIERMVRESMIPIGIYMESHLNKITEKSNWLFNQFTNRKNSHMIDPCTIFTRLKMTDIKVRHSLMLSVYFSRLTTAELHGIRKALADTFVKFIWGIYTLFRDNEKILSKASDHIRLVKYLLVCITRTQEKKNYGIPINTSFLDDTKLPMLHELITSTSFNFLDGVAGLEKMNEGYHVTTFEGK